MNGDPTFVYFLRPIGAKGPVKIGWSCQPAHRLESYQHWSPVPLEVAVAVPGDEGLEGRFHAHFRRLHSHHEWFKAAPEITATIDALRAGTFDLDGLPEAVTLHRDRPEAEVPFARWVGAIRRLGNMKKRGVPIPAEIVSAAACQYDLGVEARSTVRAEIIAFVDAHRAATEKPKRSYTRRAPAVVVSPKRARA